MPANTDPSKIDQTSNSQHLLDDDEFDEEIFVGGDLPAVDLQHKTFSDCEFREISAQEADLRHSTFEDCRFVGCDLTMSLVANAKFFDVEFVDCKLVGVDWSQISGLVFSVGFKNCILSHSSFIGLAMKNTRVLDCRADEANFAGANLNGADFAGTNLSAAKFSDTDLTRADLSLAANYEINPSDNTLRETRFSVVAALAVAKRMGIVVPNG